MSASSVLVSTASLASFDMLLTVGTDADSKWSRSSAATATVTSVVGHAVTCVSGLWTGSSSMGSVGGSALSVVATVGTG